MDKLKSFLKPGSLQWFCYESMQCSLFFIDKGTYIPAQSLKYIQHHLCLAGQPSPSGWNVSWEFWFQWNWVPILAPQSALSGPNCAWTWARSWTVPILIEWEVIQLLIPTPARAHPEIQIHSAKVPKWDTHEQTWWSSAVPINRALGTSMSGLPLFPALGVICPKIAWNHLFLW